MTVTWQGYWSILLTGSGWFWHCFDCTWIDVKSSEIGSLNKLQGLNWDPQLQLRNPRYSKRISVQRWYSTWVWLFGIPSTLPVRNTKQNSQEFRRRCTQATCSFTVHWFCYFLHCNCSKTQVIESPQPRTPVFGNLISYVLKSWYQHVNCPFWGGDDNIRAKRYRTAPHNACIRHACSIPLFFETAIDA